MKKLRDGAVKTARKFCEFRLKKLAHGTSDVQFDPRQPWRAPGADDSGFPWPNSPALDGTPAITSVDYATSAPPSTAGSPTPSSGAGTPAASPKMAVAQGGVRGPGISSQTSVPKNTGGGSVSQSYNPNPPTVPKPPGASPYSMENPATRVPPANVVWQHLQENQSSLPQNQQIQISSSATAPTNPLASLQPPISSSVFGQGEDSDIIVQERPTTPMRSISLAAANLVAPLPGSSNSGETYPQGMPSPEVIASGMTVPATKRGRGRPRGSRGRGAGATRVDSQGGALSGVHPMASVNGGPRKRGRPFGSGRGGRKKRDSEESLVSEGDLTPSSEGSVSAVESDNEYTPRAPGDTDSVNGEPYAGSFGALREENGLFVEDQPVPSSSYSSNGPYISPYPQDSPSRFDMSNGSMGFSANGHYGTSGFGFNPYGWGFPPNPYMPQFPLAGRGDATGPEWHAAVDTFLGAAGSANATGFGRTTGQSSGAKEVPARKGSLPKEKGEGETEGAASAEPKGQGTDADVDVAMEDVERDTAAHAEQIPGVQEVVVGGAVSVAEQNAGAGGLEGVAPPDSGGTALGVHSEYAPQAHWGVGYTGAYGAGFNNQSNGAFPMMPPVLPRGVNLFSPNDPPNDDPSYENPTTAHLSNLSGVMATLHSTYQRMAFLESLGAHARTALQGLSKLRDELDISERQNETLRVERGEYQRRVFELEAELEKLKEAARAKGTFQDADAVEEEVGSVQPEATMDAASTLAGLVGTERLVNQEVDGEGEEEDYDGSYSEGTYGQSDWRGEFRETASPEVHVAPPMPQVLGNGGVSAFRQVIVQATPTAVSLPARQLTPQSPVTVVKSEVLPDTNTLPNGSALGPARPPSLGGTDAIMDERDGVKEEKDPAAEWWESVIGVEG
ncbi:hypothetical protein HDU93_000855 [Gonapodya sp. JEL0774]|nr:hypothetical protein HDU93_000855 [Gonapodya sp. JEL0774]